MDTCRICLANGPEKDILQPQVHKKQNNKTYVDIILFCLDIQVDKHSKLSTKLCIKCYRKLTAFYKFKTLALKNDVYLKSVDYDAGIKNEIFIKDCDAEIKTEIPVNGLDSNVEIKEDVCIKVEPDHDTYESDDEFLSVIKKIKYEYVEDEIDENKPVKTKKKTKIKYGSSKKKKYASNTLKMCEECGKTVKDLKAHMLSHAPTEERKKYKCHTCEKEFASYHGRARHNKVKHLEEKKTCPICNKVVTHLRQHHRKMHDPASLPFGCVLCGRRFACRSSVEIHMTTHTRVRSHACDQCDKKFCTRTLMLMHRRQVHDKEKTHLCQLCSKSFFKKYHLQLHIRSHTKERPNKCPDCGKGFSSPSVLKSHRLIHVGDKKFACTHCDMSFVKMGYLNAHMISHTKVKPHPCRYCGVRFGRSDHRKRHEYTAHQKLLVTGNDSLTSPEKTPGPKTGIQMEYENSSQ